MNHEQLKELCALYVLDALEAEETSAFEAHLTDGCPECETELAELRRVSTGLAISVPQVEPDPAVKARLMERVEMARPLRRPVYRSVASWFPVAAAAAILAILLLGWQTLGLRRQLADQQAQIADLTAQLESEREISRLLASAASRIFELAGTEARPDANARVLWDTGDGVWYLYVNNLPPLAEDQTYQLWFLVDGAPRSAGILRTDEVGSAFLRVRVPSDVGAVGAAAISLEPAGGVPQPTGPILLLGNV